MSPLGPFFIECSFREYLPLENVISVWRRYNEHTSRVMEVRETDSENPSEHVAEAAGAL